MSVVCLSIDLLTYLWSFLGLRVSLQQACTAFLNRDIIILTMEPGQEQNRILANITQQQTLATMKWEVCLQQVVDLEECLEVLPDGRWSWAHPCHQATAAFMNHHDFHATVDHLERLVVMQLFELMKLNQSGTGTCRFSKVIH